MSPFLRFCSLRPLPSPPLPPRPPALARLELEQAWGPVWVGSWMAKGAWLAMVTAALRGDGRRRLVCPGVCWESRDGCIPHVVV